jgi:hypothetical protein
MERGFSPLVSIARAPADRVARPERSGDRQVEAADGNCNWFQKEIRLDPKISAPGASDAGIIEPRPGGTLGMAAETHTRSEGPTG